MDVRWILLAIGVATQHPSVRMIPVPVEDVQPLKTPPAAGLSFLGEEELHDIVLDRRRPPREREPARRELERRFPSDRTRAVLMNAQAWTLADQFNGAAAYALFTRVRGLYEGHSDPALQREVARAIQGQANALDMIEAEREVAGRVEAAGPDRHSPANRLRRELVERYREHRDPAIREMVVWERYNLAVTDQLQDHRIDSAALLRLVEEYGDEPGLQDLLADIFFHLGWSEADPARSLAWYSELPRRFGGSRDERIRRKVNDAYGWMVHRLEELGREPEAARVRAEYEAWSGYPLPPRADR